MSQRLTLHRAEVMERVGGGGADCWCQSFYTEEINKRFYLTTCRMADFKARKFISWALGLLIHIRAHTGQSSAP